MTTILDYDDGGLPIHIRIGVNAHGQGPLDDSDPALVQYICWCIDGRYCTVLPPKAGSSGP